MFYTIRARSGHKSCQRNFELRILYFVLTSNPTWIIAHDFLLLITEFIQERSPSLPWEACCFETKKSNSGHFNHTNLYQIYYRNGRYL